MTAPDFRVPFPSNRGKSSCNSQTIVEELGLFQTFNLINGNCLGWAQKPSGRAQHFVVDGCKQWFRQTAEKLLQSSGLPVCSPQPSSDRTFVGFILAVPMSISKMTAFFLFRPIHSPESLRLGFCADQHRANHHDRGFRICDGVQDSIQFASSQRLH